MKRKDKIDFIEPKFKPRQQFMNVTQAAEFLRVSPRTMNNERWLNIGCPYYKYGGKILYDFDDLKEYFQNRLQRIKPSQR